MSVALTPTGKRGAHPFPLVEGHLHSLEARPAKDCSQPDASISASMQMTDGVSYLACLVGGDAGRPLTADIIQPKTEFGGAPPSLEEPSSGERTPRQKLKKRQRLGSRSWVIDANPPAASTAAAQEYSLECDLSPFDPSFTASTAEIEALIRDVSSSSGSGASHHQEEEAGSHVQHHASSTHQRTNRRNHRTKRTQPLHPETHSPQLPRQNSASTPSPPIPSDADGTNH